MSLRVREWTAAGPGGVSVVGVEGVGALEHVARLVPRSGRLAPGRVVFTELRAGEVGGVERGELLDEALVHVSSPEHVELHLHGSPPVVRRVLAELGGDPEAGGARDALEALAWVKLPRAPSEACARMLLDQAEGALRRELEALCELAGDELDARLAALQEQARVGGHLMRPPRVVLAGPSNAGKSTLFNRLLGVERALVDASGGTTRDALRAPCSLGEWTVELVDTAGERELDPSAGAGGAGRVERAGQSLGRDLRREADWVAWLEPDPRAPDPADLTGTAWSRFTSRADELSDMKGVTRPIASWSAGEDACARFLEAFLEALELPGAAWSPGRAVPFDGAHRAVLGAARRSLAAGGAGAARSTIRKGFSL